MSEKRILVKLGGASVQDEAILNKVVQAIRQYRTLGYQVILVHGGGPAINAELQRRGIQWNFVRGQRVTTPEMMEVIEMVLSGLINPKIVKKFNSQGMPALGFSGVDGPTFICTPQAPELGLVGQIGQVNSRWIEDLLRINNAPVPVIAPLGTGISGETFNVNADWAAAKLATAMNVQQVLFFTDQPGIRNAVGVPIADISHLQLEELVRQEVVTGGMYTKVQAILHILETVPCVRVINAANAPEALNNERLGTWCLRENVFRRIHPLQASTAVPSMKEQEHVSV